jgi:hypothetical protein
MNGGEKDGTWTVRRCWKGWQVLSSTPCIKFLNLAYFQWMNYKEFPSADFVEMRQDFMQFVDTKKG